LTTKPEKHTNITSRGVLK